MEFQVKALDDKLFRDLYRLDDSRLHARGVVRYQITEHPGFPCRVSLLDAQVGETALLLNFQHQSADTPYRSSHAIFVTEGAHTAKLQVDEVPEVLRRRTLSLRAFDHDGMMLDAGLAPGEQIEPLIEQLFSDDRAACIHVHNANRGCYAARIDRV